MVPEDRPARPSPRRIPGLAARGLHRVMGTLYSIQPDGTTQVLCSRDYLRRVLDSLVKDHRSSADLRLAAAEVLESDCTTGFIRLQNVLDRNAGSYTEQSHARGTPEPTGEIQRIPMVLYLDSIRSPFNTGNIIRSAAAFGATGVVLDSGCPDLTHPRLVRAAMGAQDMVTCVRGDLDTARGLLAHRSGSVMVYALETGGTPLDEAVITTPAVIVLGHEQYGVSPASLETARRDGGIITIPQSGPKRSLNVGVAAGILLYHSARLRG